MATTQTLLLQVSTNISTFSRKPYFASKSPHAFTFSPTQNRISSSSSSSSLYPSNRFKLLASGRNLFSIDDGIVFGRLLNYEDNDKKRRQRRRAVVVSSNRGIKFNGGDDEERPSSVWFKLLLAIGLYALSTTEPFGWILDAIVKFWLVVVIVPVVGLGAFTWWAGRDSVVDSCPNCRKEFQIFKSMLDEDYQQCPYCTQPFSVVGNRFVKDSGNFSNQSTTAQAFNNFSARSKKGTKSSVSVVDIEAEVKDVD